MIESADAELTDIPLHDNCKDTTGSDVQMEEAVDENVAESTNDFLKTCAERIEHHEFRTLLKVVQENKKNIRKENKTIAAPTRENSLIQKVFLQLKEEEVTTPALKSPFVDKARQGLLSETVSATPSSTEDTFVGAEKHSGKDVHQSFRHRLSLQYCKQSLRLELVDDDFAMSTEDKPETNVSPTEQAAECDHSLDAITCRL